MTRRQWMNAAAMVTAMVVPPAVWAAQEPVAPQMTGMEQAAITACAQAHSQAERTIELANKRLEIARQSNSAAAMRTAVDDMQASLRQLRTEIAPCAGPQGSPPTGGLAGHVMPSAARVPAAAPGMPVANPGSIAPASAVGRPAPAIADPHAGHVMPGAPQSSASAPLAAPPQRPAAKTPLSSGRPAPAPAADPHAGHVTPPAAARPAVPAARPAAPARSVTPAVPASRTSLAGQPVPSAAVSTRTAPTPATTIAALKCGNEVDAKTAPRVLHQGQTYYFCSVQDRAEFVKNPEKFGVEASSTPSAPAHAH